MDLGAISVERYRVYQVRFQVLNASESAIGLRPTLEVRRSGDAGPFEPLPPADGGRDAPFYVAADAGPIDLIRVTTVGPGDLRIGVAEDPGAVPVDGAVSFGLNPSGPIALPAHSFTEVAFAVRATARADWLASYAFRLASTDPEPISSVSIAVTMRGKPRIELSPGQRSGITVGDPVPLYKLEPPRPLAAGAFAALPQAELGPLGPIAFTSPHLDFSLTGDSCAACHNAHTAQGPLLLQAGTPESNLCFRCHDGTGADSDIQAQYTDPTVPANDPSTSSWYSHPATSPSDHATDREDEFGGTLDRHAACADCHQPHLADGTVPTQTTAGWTASGPIMGASGVSVVNGAAGTSPTYAWNPTSTLEYELCFKCHSGFTQLPANDPAHPSRWALDKSIELNPSNASYHPIEAAGKNTTAAMANSLGGTSPYKLWTFQTDSTIRCVNCHGDSRLATPASPPGADAQLAPHAVANRGLLMAPYRDRNLKPAAEAYSAADFALCFQCHAESPMVDFSGDPNGATRFSFHGYHLNAIDAEGLGGLDIDTAGHGAGNAICAECHFRIHGSSEAVNGQADNARLVNFAPNVQPYRGTLQWTGTPGGGNCTLICHGVTHSGDSYP